MDSFRSHGFTLAVQPPLPVPAAEAYAEAALAASAGPMPGVHAARDLAWGPQAWQRMDIFAPDTPADGTRPVLVFLHGGGWTNGYKEWCGFMAPAVTGLGAVLVAPGYRLAPDHRFPACLHDVLAAVAAARDLLPRFAGDPDRLVLAGHSAGGHLAALAALRPDLARAAGLPDGVIRGVLPISGILDLAHPAPPPGSLEERVYTQVLARPEDDQDASPVSFAARAAMPFFLAWGRARHRACAAVQSPDGGAPVTRRRGACDMLLPGLDHFATHLALRDPAHSWYGSLGRMLRDAGPLASARQNTA